jgi:Lectin C-type domain
MFSFIGTGSHSKRNRHSVKFRLEALEPRSLLSIDMGPIVNPANGHTYYRLSPSNWTEAEGEAVSLGGHLATIDDSQENTWVFDTFSQHGQYGLWIGINDAAAFGQYVWSSGEPVAYTDWASGQPDHFVHRTGEVEHYGMIFVEEGGQTDVNTEEWNDFANVAFENATVGGTGGVLQGVVEVNTARPDLAATSPTWNTAQGGVDYAYTISNADLPTATTAALYWSTAPTFNTGTHSRIDDSVITTATTAQTAPYTGHIDASAIGTPPTDASYKYLLFVVNPDSTVTESDGPDFSDPNTDNVKSIPIQSTDVAMQKAVESSATSVAVDYTISNAAVTNPLQFNVYQTATPPRASAH